MNVEIFVRDMSVAEAIRWMQSKLPHLVLTEVIDDVHYLETPEVAVVVTPNMEEGPFLSIYVGSDDLPWETSGELGLVASRELARTVRWCDAQDNNWRESQQGEPPREIEWP